MKAPRAQGATRGMKLKNVEINPGRLCNNKCIFCMSGVDRDEHEPWADPKRMKAEIKLRFEEGARSLGFLGGEPTAYPHIVDCMRYAKELGYIRIALCTNSTRLSNPEFLEQCLQAGLTRVTVSVHSHLPEVEEFLVRVPGILDRKIEALRNLVEVHKRGRLPDGVSVNPVLCRQNAPHMEGFVRFFMELGVRDFRFNFIWPEADVQNDKNVVPAFSDTIPWILKLILKNEREFKTRLTFGAVPYCVLPPAFTDRWPLLEKYFYEEGNDLPTEVSFLKPDKDGRIDRFDWHQKGHESYRAKLESCRSCALNDRCMGIYRSYLDLYGPGEFKPVCGQR